MPAFLRRLLWHALAVVVLVAVSLVIGICGHVYLDGQDWHAAFLNAATTLAGMGPADIPQTTGGKVFAGLYALYAGLVFLGATGILLAPVAHRLLHKFHWEQ